MGVRVRFLVSSVLLTVVACSPAPAAPNPADKNPCDTNLYWTRYYDSADQSPPAVLARCETAVGGHFTDSPVPGVQADHFSVDSIGRLEFPVTGDYQFASMNGNVTAKVWLDDEVVLEHTNAREWGTDVVNRRVDAGPHVVRVLYSHSNGPAVQEFSVSQAARGPASGDGRYFAANSFWNQPVAVNSPVDARSAEWIAMLTHHPEIKDIDINEVTWTTAVYNAPRGTPTAKVTVRNNNASITVPYLPSFRPTQDGDAHVAIIDDVTGCEYEFQSFHPESMTAVAQATYRVDTGSGGHVSGPAHSGGELSYLGGLITPQDVQAGVINHALRFAIPINAPTYVYPGTRSDGRTPGGVPEGIRIQLDPALDLRRFDLTPFQTMVATALQRYGAFDADHAATFSISARSVIDGTRYPTHIDDLPKELLEHMRFLAPTIRSTDIQLDTAADRDCGQQR